ncbi:MAG TPA: hypothetical protein VD973_13650 [Symbiobacteriaceae bacterium]|nr:hypothetical protein [Symbiobacteriaceae bacterium]
MNLNLKNKFAVLAGSALITATVLSGAAFAATTDSTSADPSSAASAASAPAKADRLSLDQAVADGQLTQAQADILKQLGDLRTAAREKIEADSKAIVDQAVAAGTITQEEADALLSHKGHGGGKGHGKGRHGGVERDGSGRNGSSTQAPSN